MNELHLVVLKKNLIFVVFVKMMSPFPPNYVCLFSSVYFYLFIWLRLVLVVPFGIFSLCFGVPPLSCGTGDLVP